MKSLNHLDKNQEGRLVCHKSLKLLGIARILVDTLTRRRHKGSFYLIAGISIISLRTLTSPHKQQFNTPHEIYLTPIQMAKVWKSDKSYRRLACLNADGVERGVRPLHVHARSRSKTPSVKYLIPPAAAQCVPVGTALSLSVAAVVVSYSLISRCTLSVKEIILIQLERTSQSSYRVTKKGDFLPS